MSSVVQAVIRGPGVPQDAPAIVGAHAQGLPVIGELELGWRMLANQMIAVTGTNGKTTTVELIAHIHAQAGLAVAAAGNAVLPLSSLAAGWTSRSRSSARHRPSNWRTPRPLRRRSRCC